MDGLEISGLNVDLGRFALKDINLNIKSGCVTGLIGRNGAGKTTLIKTIMRQQDAVSGRILYNGKKFSEDEAGIMANLACVFDKPHFSLTLKPKRLEKIYASFYPKFDRRRYHELMQKFHLPEDRKVSKYSLGMARKLCLILALCQNGDTLILDEPTAGIDPADRAEIISLIQEYMLDESHTVLFSTHITEDLDKIADYIVMIEDGRVILDEDKVTLTENYRLVQTADITDDMRKVAIGLKQGMFGYTFLTKELDERWKNVQVKIPTVEEIFLHTAYSSSEVLSGIDCVFDDDSVQSPSPDPDTPFEDF
ncbi:MAG: ABC transporter ATP-binding protein [Clostridia bacterium]|nr:ABC transporter ATP-binding protein [Clostridia bacterium]